MEGADSGAASMAIAEYIRQFLEMAPELLNFFVRKAGHTTAFALLGFCVFNTLKHAAVKSRLFWTTWAITSAYGVTDEIYQYFVPERVMAVQDMLINSFGAFIGTLFAYILFVKGKNKI